MNVNRGYFYIVKEARAKVRIRIKFGNVEQVPTTCLRTTLSGTMRQVDKCSYYQLSRIAIIGVWTPTIYELL